MAASKPARPTSPTRSHFVCEALVISYMRARLVSLMDSGSPAIDRNAFEHASVDPWEWSDRLDPKSSAAFQHYRFTTRCLPSRCARVMEARLRLTDREFLIHPLFPKLEA